ncbi:hypothetical protein Efla_002486 [Eimeria flavescens]
MAKRRKALSPAPAREETAAAAAAAAPRKVRKPTSSSSTGSSSSKKKKVIGDASAIRNKARRAAAHGEQRRQRKEEKRLRRKDRKKRERRGETIPKQTPRTIESMRRPDDSIVAEDDAEAAEAEEADEFAPVFRGEKQPKLFITTSKRPSARFYDFLKEMLLILPSAYYYKRLQTSVKTACAAAIEGGFSAVLLFQEKKGKPHGLYICHLPEGPTCYFRMTNVLLAQDLPGGGSSSTHTPELLFNNFTTALGRRVARLLSSLFPIAPQFTGRRLITFHNQRDFIFFRHHRYIFRPKKRLRPLPDMSATQQQQGEDEGQDTDGEEEQQQPIDPKVGAALQEIGPRFTLKLMWLHAGLFNTKEGLYEFVWRPDLKVDRKRMLI